MMNSVLILLNICNIIIIKIINFFYKLENYNSKIGNCLKNILINSGPIAIKIGQCISSRDDILPLEICNILSELTTDVEYYDDSDIYYKIYFSNKLSKCNLNISDCIKIGSGTIAVVYKTKIDNSDVILKIKRPNIKYEIERSFRIIYFYFMFYSVHSIDICEKLNKLKNVILKQIDFGNEFNELNYFYNIYKNSSDIIIPKTYDKYCSDDVIAMEYIEGIAINKLSNDMKRRIGKLLWKFSFESCFIHGKYHSDLHKGNLLLTSNDKLCILDYGLTGKISGFDKSILFNYNTHIFKKQWKMAAKLYVNKMVVNNDMSSECKHKFMNEVEEILKLCLSKKVPNLVESVYKLEECSKKNNTKFNNKYCDFELAFSTLISTLYGLNCFNIFDFEHF